MDAGTRRTVSFVTSQLVFVAAVVHIGLGLLKWYQWFQGGFLLPRDLRWPAFVLSGGAILVGMYLAWIAEDTRPYYAVGAVAMAGYIIGYFGWHLSGHRPQLFLGSGPGAGQESLSIQWFLDHLFAGSMEFFALSVEATAFVGLVVLFLSQPAGETDSHTDSDAAEGSIDN